MPPKSIPTFQLYIRYSSFFFSWYIHKKMLYRLRSLSLCEAVYVGSLRDVTGPRTEGDSCCTFLASVIWVTRRERHCRSKWGRCLVRICLKRWAAVRRSDLRGTPLDKLNDWHSDIHNCRLRDTSMVPKYSGIIPHSLSRTKLRKDKNFSQNEWSFSTPITIPYSK